MSDTISAHEWAMADNDRLWQEGKEAPVPVNGKEGWRVQVLPDNKDGVNSDAA